MKNDLTTAEWLALADFLGYLDPSLIVVISPMTSTEENRQKALLAEAGKEKFLKIAKTLKVNSISKLESAPIEERWAGDLD